MILNALVALVVALGAQAVIYCGIAFVNGQFFPGVLASVYDLTGTTVRVVLMTLTASMAANFLMPVPYQLVRPGLAGMLILGTLVVVLVGKAILLGEGRVTWQVMVATAALAVSAAWVVHALNASTH